MSSLKRKILSSLLAVIMLFSMAPQVLLAADDVINVTLKFDASVVTSDMDTLYSDLIAAYIIDEETTNIPSDITVTVPKGSTVQEVLEIAQGETGFTAVGIDEGYVTQIGYIGSKILENLVSIPVGDYYSGNIFNCAGWSFYIDGEEITEGIDTDTVTDDGAMVEGRFGLAVGWDSDWNMLHYDEIFLENYAKLKELTEKNVDTSDFSEKQKQKLATEKAEAETLLAEIYNEASLNQDVSETLIQLHPDFRTSGGMWIGYFEEKGTSFWGTGSPSELLEIAIKELDAAINPLPENLLSELYVTTLFGTAEGNLILDFASDKYEYVIKDYTKDNFLPKFMKWKSVAAAEDATVTASLNGESVSASDLSDNWKQYNDLDWTDRILNTLTLTVAPPEGSALEETTYTIKIYSEITDEKKVSLAKEKLTWGDIKGLNKIPSEITTSLALPSKIEIPDIGEVSATWTGFDGVILGENGTLLSRPQSATTITLVATLCSGESSDTCEFELTILPVVAKDARDEQISTLLENIAGTYTDKSQYWEVMDMGAYKKYAPETEAVLSDRAKQKFINESIEAVSKSEKDTDLAKAILALTAQGKDATQLYTVNSNTPIDAVKKLNDAEHSTSVWSAPYTLAAYNKNEYKNREKELSLVNALLASQGENGAWDEYGTIDTTANAIAGLAFYINDENSTIKENVNKAIEDALTYLSTQQNADGSFSDLWSGRNSNSTAIVAIALAAAGVDVEEDARFIKGGNNIIDGLLSFALEDNSGFGYTDNITASDYSTEQAFRALIALAGAIKADAAYNVYDFNGISISPARATDEYTGSNGPSEPQGDNISVSLTIKADNGYWLNRYTVTLPGNGATVYHVFVKGCSENDLKYEGADKGYVSSISKGDKTLAEFGAGKNSGWLYKLNGEAPLLGIRECEIKNGDSIQFFYTQDYTKESGVGSWSGSKTQEKKEEPKEEPKEEAEIPAFTESTFSDIKKDDWYYESVKYVYENNLMQGTDSGFEPESKMTRAMLVTVLYRMANPENCDSKHDFKDVPQGQWYSDAVLWAAANGIVSGISKTQFAPDSDVTREQMALIIYRFAKLQGYGIIEKADISGFADASDVSDWALDAIK
ncbi:MAG: S-layer homology domain-containing protein, partial [Clostridia bacterium]|nr:S-layer homology domain-containing protein [Clostridia bacterium]